MKTGKELFGDIYQKHKQEVKTTAPHELADVTNLIEKHIGFTKKYGRGYWLKKAKYCTYAQMEHFLTKELPGAKQYVRSVGGELNAGAWLTNKLK